MKKLIISFTLVVILFNFIFDSKSYCEQQEILTTKSVQNVANDPTTMKKALDNSSEESSGSGDINVVETLLMGVFNVVPALVRIAMMLLTSSTDISIEGIVFNKNEFFNVNYFDYSIGKTELKACVAKFFAIFKVIAVGLELLVLIYIGIRMAFSTLAPQKTKYKKMFIGWVESLIILFSIQYLLAFIFMISDKLTEICLELETNLDPNGECNFEQIIMDSITPFVGSAKGFNYVTYSVLYWFLTFIQIKFYITFVNRLIAIGFLIMVSPFISVIYSIDKAGDGRAQSFEIWFKEIVASILIQPIYAFTYLIFILTAGQIAKYSIIFAAMLLLIMTKIEKFVFKMFNIHPQSFQGVKEQKVGRKNI